MMESPSFSTWRAHTTLRARKHCGDPDGLWWVQGFGGGVHSELEQGARGQHKEAVAMGGSSQSKVDPRVRCDNEPKGNEVRDKVTRFGQKVAFIKGSFGARANTSDPLPDQP